MFGFFFFLCAFCSPHSVMAESCRLWIWFCWMFRPVKGKEKVEHQIKLTKGLWDADPGVHCTTSGSSTESFTATIIFAFFSRVQFGILLVSCSLILTLMKKYMKHLFLSHISNLYYIHHRRPTWTAHQQCSSKQHTK